MSSASPSPKRRRGAQPGNANALKHGYYASRLPAADVAAIKGHVFFGLEEEIELLRVFIARLADHINENLDLDKVLSIIRILDLTLISLSRLKRTERFLGEESSGLQALLDQAIPEVYAELTSAARSATSG